MHKKFIPKVIRNSINNSICLQPPTNVTSTLIWLHGLCDTSQGFYSFFAHSHSPLYNNNMKIKLLQAPMKRITINSNQPCHSWFKRNQEEERQVFDFTDIEDSLKIIDEQVKKTAQELYNNNKNHQINPYHRIYLGGFSQGGVMALNYGLRSDNIIGGAISFSGYALKSFDYKNFKKLPILLSHGQSDQIVKQIQALKSYENLLKDQSLVFYQPFEKLEHSVCLQQLDLLSNWIGDMDKMRQKLYKKTDSKETQNNK